MIATFKEIVKKEGYETLRKYDVDKWMGGILCRRHITRIMVMDCDMLCLWYKDYYFGKQEDDKFVECDGVDVISIMHDNPTTLAEEEFIWADTEEEMMSDYKCLKDKIDAEDNHKVNNCLSLLKKFSESYRGFDYELQNKIDNAIKDENNTELKDFRNKMWNLFNEEDENYELQEAISRIYLEHVVDIKNKDNNSFWTSVNLDKAVAVYQCKCNGVECMCIDTVDGKEYNVYKDINEYEYKALCVLYDKFNI